MMKELLKKGLSLGLGFAVVSKEQIEKVIDDLVKKGDISATESKDLMKELVQKGEQQQDELNTKLREQVRKILEELNLPSKADFERLEQRLAQLESTAPKERS